MPTVKGQLQANNGIMADWIMFAISSIIVGLRMYVRWFIQGNLSLSDVFLVLAVLFFAYKNSSDTYGHTVQAYAKNVNIGSGDIGFRATNEKFIGFLKLFYTAVPIFYTSLWCIKASFLLFYNNLFPSAPQGLRLHLATREGILRIGLYVTSVLCIVGWLVTMFGCFFACHPVSSNWQLDRKKSCTGFLVPWVNISSTAFHLGTDLLVFGLPLLLIYWMPNFSSKEKVQVSFMFALGGLSIGTATIRFAFSMVGGFDSTLIGVMGALEMSTALIVACCPQLRLLWRYKRRQKVDHENSIREMEGPSTGSSGSKLTKSMGKSQHEKETPEWGTFLHRSQGPKDWMDSYVEEGYREDELELRQTEIADEGKSLDIARQNTGSRGSAITEKDP